MLSYNMFSKCSLVFSVTFALLSCGCSDEHKLWREQKLPSSRSVKVTSCLLVWGSEHDERIASNDCFALDFVYTSPDANNEAHEQEAKEVFELIRPVSELWGFTTATVTAFPTIERERHYDFFIFERSSDGRWSVKCEKR
jgi:hypothetical protein